MPIRSARIACLVLLFGVAATVSKVQAQTAFSFLRLDPSARAASLGGAFSAVFDDDVNALFYNPALLNDSMHRALSVSYLNHVAGVNGGFVAHARHVDGLGTLGAGLRYVGWGRLDGYDQEGNETGDFGAGDAALTLSFARAEQDRFQYGAGIHAAFSSIDTYSATALAADVGVAYHFPDHLLTLSASANNVGVVLDRLGASRDELPLDLRIGLSKRLAYVPLLISVSGYDLNRVGEDSGNGSFIAGAFRHVAFGGEFRFSEAFNVRLGYNHRRHQDLKMKSRLDLAGLGVGVGIKVSTFRFDYAFSSWSSLGGLHRFTLRTVI
ncbi:MAG: type IX secretion system protein PorQ [Rhodothermales bacterium]